MQPPFRIGGRAGIAKDVDEEIAFHVEMRTRKLIERGMDPREARQEALRRFGAIEPVRDYCVTMDKERERAMRRADVLGEMRQDLGYAVRMLRRNAGFTIVVTLTLALGIGANASIFSLLNAVLLRQLPVPAPGRLVSIGNPGLVSSFSAGAPRADILSTPLYKDLRAGGGALVTGLLAAGRAPRLDARIDSAASGLEHPRGRYVSANYFAVLEVGAELGRVFTGAEDDPGGAQDAVISDQYWSARFNRDPAAIGRSITINGTLVRVIGVTPRWFSGEAVGFTPDIWLPLGLQPLLHPHLPLETRRDLSSLLALGRLRPGVTLEQAASAYSGMIRRIVTENSPALTPAQLAAQESALNIRVQSGARGFSRVEGRYGKPLVTLMIGVGVLMLIICGNVANLLLARAVARSREMSVRLALGAGRGRLIRQLLTESMVLALLGAAGGLILARWGSGLLLSLAADGSPAIPLDTGADVRVIGFTLALSLVAVALFGLAPAWRASRVSLADTMRAHARNVGAAGSHGSRLPLGKVLITAQVALSLILLVGAGLLVKNLKGLEAAPTGLDHHHLLVVEVDATGGGYQGPRLNALVGDVRDRLGRLPGVASVSYSENGIFSGTESRSTLQVPGFTAASVSDTVANYDLVGPGYVTALGGLLREGRELNELDGPGAQSVAMINETMARFYFPSGNAVGGTLRIDDSITLNVVGVVADVKDQRLVGSPVRRFYVSYDQAPTGEPGNLRFIVRTSGDPLLLAEPVRQAIRARDADLSVSSEALAVSMRRSIREQRLLARLASGFGALALALSAIGLYGVMTYAVSQRTGEMGLRSALGAQRSDVLRLVLGDALKLVAVGVIVGVPAALASARLLRSQLQDVGTADPLALIVAVAVLGASATVAALLPALRASRVAPLVALRQE